MGCEIGERLEVGSQNWWEVGCWSLKQVGDLLEVSLQNRWKMEVETLATHPLIL